MRNHGGLRWQRARGSGPECMLRAVVFGEAKRVTKAERQLGYRVSNNKTVRSAAPKKYKKKERRKKKRGRGKIEREKTAQSGALAGGPQPAAASRGISLSPLTCLRHR